MGEMAIPQAHTTERNLKMAKQLNNVQRVQQYLKKIFRLLNEQIFDNELEDVQVVLSNSSRCYGYYTLNGSTWVGQASGEVFNQHEIGISAQFLATRDVTSVVATICHECCHHYAYIKGIRDVSRNGYWHNKRFKEIAEQHGLIVERHEKVGYGVTSCSERLLQFCIDNDLQEFQLNRSSDYFVAIGGSSSPSSGGSTTTTTRRSSSYKLLCPSCGCTVRATRLGVQLMCISCSEEMQYV